MQSFLARQPIFDRRYDVAGYELLYRDAENTGAAAFQDGDAATRRLLSDAVTVFGLRSLTDSKPAFINFTDRLILSDFVRLVSPEQIIVEILEDAEINDTLIRRVQELKEAVYSFALDDYGGSDRYEALFPFIDILKVDFRLTNERRQAEIAERMKRYKGCRLLAEKVESTEEFEWAKKQGYQLFQGYFFERPVTLKKELPPLSYVTFGRLMNELQRPEEQVDFQQCARIVHSDAVMTYQLMKKAQSLRYYRGNTVSEVVQMLMMLGVQELRRWLLLILARSTNVTGSDEVVRGAYLRGCFGTMLALRSDQKEVVGENAFLTGMFSLMPKIMGKDMREVVAEVELPDEVRQALTGETENWYSVLVRYLDVYEMRSEATVLPDLGLALSSFELVELYCKSLAEADAAFSFVNPYVGGMAPF